MPRSRSPSGQRRRSVEREYSRDTRHDRRDHHTGRRHADDLPGERRRFDDRRPTSSRDEKPMNGDKQTDYKRSSGRSQNEDRDRYGRGDRDQRRDRGNDGERERDRIRDRDRDRAGPSRRSASPPPRTSRPRSAKPPSPSVSRSASPVDKAKPNFAPSGLLAADTNTVKAVDGSSTILKYNEPPEARKPVLGWRLYVFKGSEQVELLHIHRQSAYLIGRDRLVADIAVDHPSCSKQHAVIQYRYVPEKDEFGGTKSVVKPFIIDLESTNGTHVNDEAIPVSRYYELKAGDVIKFGQSTREYVLLHDEAT